MKNKLFVMSIISLTLIACERQDKAYSSTTTVATENPDFQNTQDFRNNPDFNNTNTQNTQNYQRDNTGINVRDRNSRTLTPLDQNENSTDLTITQQIRRAVVADGSLSINAKNVKIITRNGMVTLRGPVANDQERARIADIAKNISGVSNVDNQLEVASNNRSNF